MIYTILFWLIIQLLALLALPLAVRLFRWLPDRGYTVAKALGLLLASYLLWLGASLGVLKNDLGGILFAVLLLAALSGWLLYRQPQVQNDLLDLLHNKRSLVLAVETLFTLCFILWVVLRAYAPYKIMNTGGEKFMEIAFLNGILNSPHFPPLDPWLSGFAISYYYFGYVMMALLTRLSGAPSGIAFDLYDALLFALTAQGAFGIVYNLVAAHLSPGQDHAAIPPGRPLAAGWLGALFVAVIGNLEGFFELLYTRGILPTRFFEWLAIPGMLEKQVTGRWELNSFMWWWTASRVIQDVDLNYQNLGISPITEFPFFSFLLGDNHPHVLALPFVLMAISLAFNLLMRWAAPPVGDAEPMADASPAPTWQHFVRLATFEGDWLLFGFTALLLGGLAFLNTWDFPIYLGLIVLAWALVDFRLRRAFDTLWLLQSAILGAVLLVASIVPYTFFYLSFSSQAGGVLPQIFPPTRLPQYLVMFGAQVFLVAAFLLAWLAQARDGRGRPALVLALAQWGKVVLVSLLLLGFVLGIVALAVTIQSAGGSLNPTVSNILGKHTLSQSLLVVLQARLRDPWLFLLLTALLALSLTPLLHFPYRKVYDSPPFREGLGVGKVGSADSEVNASPPLSPSEGREGGVGSANSGAGSVGGDSSLLFVCLLIFTGLTLTFITEFIYLRDGFGVRMNTIFKFWYQGWIMLGIASAYALWWLFSSEARNIARILRSALQIGALLLIAASLVYPVLSYYTRAGNFEGEPNLDGASGVAQSSPDDWAAIQWLQQNAVPKDSTRPVPTILEAPGARFASYVYEGRISTFTGLPTLLGWPGHENQWRGSYDEQGRREPDIQTIYATHDGQTMLDLLRKWDVDYVVVGLTEQSYVNQLCSTGGMVCSSATALRKFGLFLKPVFNQGQVTIYQVP